MYKVLQKFQVGSKCCVSLEGDAMLLKNGFSYKGNSLKIGERSKEFTYLIRDAKLCKDKVIVLLEIPFKDDEINNLYALNEKCEIIWKVEDLKAIFKSQVLLPYEQMIIEDNIVIVSDFYGRRYYINCDDGKIIKRDITK